MARFAALQRGATSTSARPRRFRKQARRRSRRIKRLETNRFSPLEVKQLEAPARDLKSDALRGSSRLESALDNLVTIKIGDRGESVKLLQQALENMGFALPEFGADGIFGAETEAAVMAYQASQGLKVDGLVGPETVGAMDTELAGRKVTSTPAGFPFDGVVDTKSGNLRLHTEPVVKPANHIGVLVKGANVHVLAPAANNMFKVSGTLMGRTKPSTGFVQQSFIKKVAGASPAPAVKPALTLSGNSYVDSATESRKNIQFNVAVPSGLNMKDFALVNFIQGSMKKADGTFFKVRLYGALVDANFAAFQVDSTDVDPVYWSTSSSRWNYTPVGKTGFLATDSPGPALSTEKGAEYKLDFRIELHELAKVPTTTTGSLSVSPLASALWDYKVKIDGSGKFSH